MNFLSKLFSDSGDVSAMRIMSMFSLAVGASIAFISLYKNNQVGEAAPAIGIFVGAAFGGKLGQKYMEGNNNVK